LRCGRRRRRGERRERDEQPVGLTDPALAREKARRAPAGAHANDLRVGAEHLLARSGSGVTGCCAYWRVS
jgi:hypothetical protein